MASSPKSAPAPAAASPAPAPNGARPTLDAVRGGWAEIVEHATPVIKPLLRECRPIAIDGARLTLAFPEGREFMRGRIEARSGSIEALLATAFGGEWAIECVASNIELEPLSVEAAIAPDDDPEARALLDNVLKITGGELVDVPEVR